jgi:hypothetical protein
MLATPPAARDTAAMQSEPGMGESEPIVLPPGGGRLSIRHLLVWTAICGLYLAWYRWAHLDDAQAARGSDGIMLRARAVLACLNGGAALGVGLLWWSRRAARDFPAYPGEWLWLARGSRAFVGLAAATAVTLLTVRLQPGYANRYTAIWGVAIGLFLLIDVLALRQVRSPRRWRAYMWVRLLTEVLSALSFVTVSVFSWWWGTFPIWWFVMSLPTLSAVCVLIVGFCDWRAPESYPWTHWVGIGIVAWDIPVYAVVLFNFLAQ